MFNSVYDKSFLPRRIVDGISLYDFEGKQFYGPENCYEFLSFVYGNDYMTPKKYDAHVNSYDDVKL